jgi:hypothetical protein
VVDGDGAGVWAGKGSQWTLFASIYAQFKLLWVELEGVHVERGCPLQNAVEERGARMKWRDTLHSTASKEMRISKKMERYKWGRTTTMRMGIKDMTYSRNYRANDRKI